MATIRLYNFKNLIFHEGHSLGAHIGGSAGRNFYYKTSKLLPRITGLDPANPWYKSYH